MEIAGDTHLGVELQTSFPCSQAVDSNPTLVLVGGGMGLEGAAVFWPVPNSLLNTSFLPLFYYEDGA